MKPYVVYLLLMVLLLVSISAYLHSNDMSIVPEHVENITVLKSTNTVVKSSCKKICFFVTVAL